MVSTSSSSDDQPSSLEESFAALFEESLKRDEVKEGEIVKGKVISVGPENIVVDIGYKSEGTIPAHDSWGPTAPSR